MNFTDALSRMVEYSNPNSKNSDVFFCITNEKLLKKHEVFIIDFYGLSKVFVDFEYHKHFHTNDNVIKTCYLKDTTWHYITTWTDLRKLHDAIT